MANGIVTSRSRNQLFGWDYQAAIESSIPFLRLGGGCSVGNRPKPFGVLGGERHRTRIAYLTFAVLGVMGLSVVVGDPTSIPFLTLMQLAVLRLGVWLMSSMRNFGLAFRKAIAPYAETSAIEASALAVTGSSRRAARRHHAEPAVTAIVRV